MATYSIRPARVADTLAINTLQEICLPGDSPLLVYQTDAWWVATHDGEVVGFISLTAHPTGAGYIQRAGVSPDHRGQGLYVRLLRAATRCASTIPLFTSVVTDCTCWNVGSINGLIKAGFLAFSPSEPWALPDSIYWIRPC